MVVVHSLTKLITMSGIKPKLYLIPMGGFGNRMWSYEIAYQINKKFGYPWDIIMGTQFFPEVKYLDFPYVKQGEVKPTPIIKSLEDVDITKDYKIGSYAVKLYSELRGKEYTIDEPITLKDKSLEEEIKLKMKDVIGVHIRRGDVLDESLNSNHPNHGNQPIIPDNHYREVMSKYKDKKFYISTDGSWDEVKFLYDEFNIINPYIVKKTAPTSGTLRCKHTFTKVEALDLFHLLHSEEFIMGLSTWSEWVQRQRRYENCKVPPINFK